MEKIFALRDNPRPLLAFFHPLGYDGTKAHWAKTEWNAGFPQILHSLPPAPGRGPRRMCHGP